jgi:hypothetical protein
MNFNVPPLGDQGFSQPKLSLRRCAVPLFISRYVTLPELSVQRTASPIEFSVTWA